jgi:hypothetical protein
MALANGKDAPVRPTRSDPCILLAVRGKYADDSREVFEQARDRPAPDCRDPEAPDRQN